MAKCYYNCDSDVNVPHKCNSEYCDNIASCNDASSYVVGNSVKFSIDDCDKEIKADITVDKRDTVRVWGQINDCEGNPVPYAYVKLAKICGNSLHGIAHTITDCLGYYQFDICTKVDGCEFTLIVGKASVGNEKVISSGVHGTSCNPCNDLDNPNYCPSCRR